MVGCRIVRSGQVWFVRVRFGYFINLGVRSGPLRSCGVELGPLWLGNVT